MAKGYIGSYKMSRKTRKERLAWWNSLGAQQKSDYLESKCKQKAKRRIQKYSRDMIGLGVKYDCSKCILGETGNCVDKLPTGCGYFDSQTEEGFYYKTF